MKWRGLLASAVIGSAVGPVVGLGVGLVIGLASCHRSDSVGGSPQAARAGELRGARLVVLGTAQDGGLPHASCGCARCAHARHEPSARRRVASLGLVFPAQRVAYLVDATPDLPEQLELVRAEFELTGSAAPRERVERAPLGAPRAGERSLERGGILLTHAHMGHYLGLAYLGFEVVHTQGLPVFATERMGEFLTHNGPWSQLVELGEIELETMRHDVPFELAGGVRVTAFAVPHRDEFSDTVGLRIDGPRQSFLYVPDTDDWALWSPSLVERLEGIDVALLDGSFYSLDELPGRDLDQVRHPLMFETMDLLEQRVARGELRVLFTHLNHSNLALGPGDEASSELERRGFAVLAEGAVFEL